MDNALAVLGALTHPAVEFNLAARLVGRLQREVLQPRHLALVVPRPQAQETGASPRVCCCACVVKL